MNFDNYRKIEAINASLVKKFAESELVGYNYFLNPPEPTQALINGQAFHAIIESKLANSPLDSRFVNFLEIEKEQWGDSPNRRKKDYQDWKRAILGQDIIFYDNNIAIAAEKLVNSSIFSYLKKQKGEVEKSLFAETKILSWEGEPKTIPIKGRFDYFLREKRLIIDWKTIAKLPTKKNIIYEFRNRKYDIQAGIYCKLAELTYNQPFDFLFVFAQTTEPYEIALLYIITSDAMGYFSSAEEYIFRAYEVCYEKKTPKFLYETQQGEYNKLGAYFIN